MRLLFLCSVPFEIASFQNDASGDSQLCSNGAPKISVSQLTIYPHEEAT